MSLAIDDENADTMPAVYINQHLLSSIHSMQPSLLNYYQIKKNFYFRDDWQEMEDSFTEKYVDFELIQIDSEASVADVTSDDNTVKKDEYETEKIFELSTNAGSLSYAEKLKSNIQPPVTVTFEEKIFDIRFESWHTIIHSGLEEVYCMMCEQKMNKQNMLHHCKFVHHLEKLQKCKIIDSNEDCLIRKVNEKFSHCSKCNTLHFVYETRNHIRKAHGILSIDNEQTGNAPKTIGNEFLAFKDDEINKILPNNEMISDTNNNHHLTVNTETYDKDASRPSANGNYTHTANLKVGNDKNYVNATKDSRIIDKNSNNYLVNPTNDKIPKFKDSVNTFDHLETEIFIFGCQLTLPMLSLNMICKSNDNIYYCGVCHLSFLQCHLDYHLNLVNHKTLLTYLHFLPEYSVNLIRYVRQMFHCSLCNVPVYPPFILQHNLEPNHIRLLTLALTKQQILSPNQSRIATTNKYIETDKDLTTNTGVDSKETSNNLCVSEDRDMKHNKKSIAVDDKLNDDGAANVNIEPGTVVNYVEFEANDQVAKKKGFSVFDDKVCIITTSARFDISAAALNTLVHNCDGDYYCGACEINLDKENTYKHIDNEGHRKNIEKYLFLEDYIGDNLIKQLSSKYHCATCNVLIKQTQIEHHLEWPLHKSLIEQCKLKKYRHRDKKRCVTTQKKRCFLTKESPIEIKLRAKIVAATECQHLNSEQETVSNDVETAETEINVDSDAPTASPVSMERKTSFNSNKSFNDTLGGKELTFVFLNWNGIRKVRNGSFKCIICQIKFESEIEEHVETEEHVKMISNCNVLQRFLPAVIRKIDNRLAHCVLCNKQLSNNDIKLLKHVKNISHKTNLRKNLKLPEIGKQLTKRTAMI